MDKVTRQCPQTTTFFEEKGEPKRYRTEVLPLTSLTPYRYARPAHYLPVLYVVLILTFALCRPDITVMVNWPKTQSYLPLLYVVLI